MIAIVNLNAVTSNYVYSWDTYNSLVRTALPLEKI